MNGNAETKTGIGRFVAGSFRLQGRDFWILALVVAGVWAAMQTLFGILWFFSKDPETLSLGIPGLVAFIAACLLGILTAAGRFSVEFAVGIHMSRTRREMLLSGVLLSLATNAVMLATAAALNGIWGLAFGRMDGAKDVLAMLPAWGWAAALYVPAAAGMTSGGIVMRFGRRGFWFLYAVFMVCMLGPGIVDYDMPAAGGAMLLTVLPYVLPCCTVFMAALGTVLLRNVSVTE